MSREFPELDQVRIVVADAVKERHLAIIASEIRAGRVPRFKRFRLLAVATALLLLLPVVALAAEDAVPGDVLYAVKRLFEPVVSLFDRDVEVDHRVEELEILHEREADVDLIWQQVDSAREVVTDPDSDHAERLRRVVDELERSDRENDSVFGLNADRSRGETSPPSTDGSSDSTVGLDEGTTRSEETTTTQRSDRTSRPSDRNHDR